MDEGTPLGGLEFEDDAKLSHGLHAVLSSLWGRGYLAHRLRIRFPEDKGVQRPKQPDQPRRLTGPAGGGLGHGLTTLGKVSAVSTTLPRPRGSVPRPPGGGLGASAMIRRPRAPQAHASLGRCWGLVLKCYKLRTRQHEMLNINALRPRKHYFPKDLMGSGRRP
jgi:hypothetical protein